MDGMAHTRSAGFSMTELVITMAIVSILLTIGIPSFKYVTTSNRIATELNGLLGDMQYARSVAIKEGLPVTVCASSDGQTCDGTSLWENGWIVFLDSNDDQAVDNGEVVMRVQPGFATFSSTDTFQPQAGSFTYITFNREGYAATGNAGIVTLQLHDLTNGTQWTRCLAITPVGMLSSEKAGVGACT